MTRGGWLVITAGLVLFVVGRILGLPDLYIFGAVLECLVAVCVAWVLVTRPRLEVDRKVRPSRVNVGTNSRVELAITNAGARRSPVMCVRDPVSGTAGAEILLAPLAPGEQVTSAYHLPTSTRGLLTVGPLDTVGMDPFGLTRLGRRRAGVVELTVLPRVDPITPPPSVAGDDPHGGEPRARQAGRTGEEFHALRPYVVGDDLRRVHWASTARTGEVMVRHDETPWQGRTTVLLDVRADGELLEEAVEAAASVLVAAWRRGDQVRLVTTAGSDSGYGTSHLHLDGSMEHLALVESAPSDGFDPLVHLLEQASSGTLVAILAAPSAPDLDSVSATRATFRAVTIVVLDPDSPSRVDPAEPGRPVLLSVGPDRTFPEVWEQATGSRRRVAERGVAR